VKIIEISSSQIKYKQNTNLNGPVYVIDKTHVIKIVYENGVTEKLITGRFESKNTLEKKYFEKNYPKKNNISLNVFDLTQGSVTMSYEYKFQSGHFSLKSPLSVGFIELGLADSAYNSNDRTYYHRHKIFSTGLAFYFYPSIRKKVQYFVGPSFEYGQFKYWTLEYYNYYKINREKGSYTAFILENGIQFHPNMFLSISMKIGVGYAVIKAEKLFGNPYETNNGNLNVRGGLSIGYKF